MPGQKTNIRLINTQDAAAIAAHRLRDERAFAPWEPAQPASFYTTEGQIERIEGLLREHRNGTTWPGVVLADDVVIGQVTVSTILLQPFLRKASLGYWIGSTFHSQGHASRAVGLVLG